MNGSSSPTVPGPTFPALRALAGRVLADHPGLGLLVEIPVEGGVLLHPVTRAPIAAVTAYGAFGERVKILSPRILATLPPLEISGVRTRSDFFALLARSLGLALQELGRIRDAVLPLGIPLDLETDVLRLRCRVLLGERELDLATAHAGEIQVVAIGDRPLWGRIPRGERTLHLCGSVADDLQALASLAESLARSLEQPAPAPLPPPPPPPAEEVVELVETVEEPAPTATPPTAPQAATLSAPSPAAGAAPPAPVESAGALKLQEIVERLGPEAEISAQGGRLRLVIPMKSVQGVYTFYVEQRAGTVFSGTLVSAKGSRIPVSFDLRTILDLKQVFDQAVLGR